MIHAFNRFIPRGSTVLFVTTLGSYMMGLFRDRIFAQSFGASAQLDAYNAAFLVPDFVFNLLVASGIAAAVVPLFAQLKRRSTTEAFAYMNAVVTAATVTTIVAGMAIIVAAPVLSKIITPGLDAEGQALVVRLMRVLAVSPILFGASNALGAMLVAQRRFLFYGMSPMLYNLGIIGGTLLLAPQYGIAGAAYGTLAGAGLHMAARVYDGVRSGWRFKRIRRWPKEPLKQTVRLMIPKMFGHPVEMATFWVFTSIASLLAPGSIVVLNFARNFQSVPVSLLGISMSTAAFPALSEAASRSRAQLRELLYRTAGSIFLVSILAAGAMYVIRKPLVAILLGGGAFDEAAVAKTAAVLGVFCLAIPTESLNHLLARAFYATRNTIIPVAFSVASLVIAGTSAYMLSQSLGVLGLPLGFFFGSLTKTAGLFVLLNRRLSQR